MQRQMDTIVFGCCKSDLEDYLTTSILVNGYDLKVLIEGIEADQMADKGLTLQNGCYEGISHFIAFDNQNHFLRETLRDYMYPEERFTLYDYKYSGVPGDHSLTCKIAIGNTEVVWYDFKNYSKIISFEIDYSGLEFRFSKTQYCQAIATVRNP